MRSDFKKLTRLTSVILLSLFLLLTAFLLGFILFLKTEKGQLWLTSNANSFLASQLETRLQIDQVRFNFPNSLQLKGITIYDHKDNLLLEAPLIDAGLNLFTLKSNSLIFSHLTLNQPKFYGRQYKGDTSFNYNYVINNISSEEPDESEGIYRTLFNKVRIQDGMFVHKNLQDPEDTTKNAIHFDYLKCQSLNLNAGYLQFIDGRITADIHHLSFKEKSGFTLEKLQTDLTIDDSRLSFEDLHLQTPRSLIQEQITMTYDSQEDLGNFIEEVDLLTRFKNSHLSLYDLSFFAPGISQEDKRIQFEGNLKGKINGFKGKNFRIAIGERTFFKGNLNFNGLPNIEETFINIKCKKAELDQADLKAFLPDLDLPGNLETLGIVSFEGNFTGFVSDFVAYGEFDTKLGKASTDINLKMPADEGEAQYSGFLELSKFDIGKFTGNEDLLGKVSMKGNVEGKGLSIKTLEADLNASVSRLDLNDYQYKDIQVEGTFTEKLFKGQLVINDPNIGLDFKGLINLAKAKPLYDFNANVTNANLYALNLTKDTLILNTNAKMNFSANNADDIEGNVVLKNNQVTLDDRVLDFEQMKLESVIEGGKKGLTLQSDLADISLTGDYNLTSLGNIAQMTMARYIDRKLVPGEDFEEVHESIAFDVHIKNAAFIMKVAKTDFVIEDDSKIRGSVNTKTSELTLSGTIPGIYYKDYHLDDISLQGSGSKKELFFKAGLNTLYESDSIVLNNSEVSILSGKKDTLQFNIKLIDKTYKNKARLLGSILPDEKFVTGKFENSTITLGDTTWQLSSKAITHYYDSTTKIPRLFLKNGPQSILINGEMSKTNSTPLKIAFHDMQLGNITQSLFPQYSAYTGTVNGQVLLHNLYDNPYFNAGLMINPLFASGIEMGALTLNTNYRPDSRNINVESTLNSPKQENLLNLKGYLNFHEKENMNLLVAVNETPLNLIEGMTGDFVSNLKGTIDGGVQISGSFEEPAVQGFANLNKAQMKVNYLNTTYQFDHTLEFDSKSIQFDQLQLKDVNNNAATVNGAITHDFFNDFNLNLNVEARNFQALNTEKKHNKTFYGQAYATGQMQFSGPIDNITMDMNLKPEKNTEINLPVSQSNEFREYDFIRFTDQNQSFKKEQQVDFKGINMNMNVEMTPDALIKIIFDPKVGDIMKARGSGNLRMEITSAGDFNMFGNYSLKEGDYLFTAFGIVNKRFNLKEGSNIKWNGNPYDAQLDIEAAYQVQASPKPLIPEANQQNNNYSQKVPVEAQLFMSGALFSPDMKLDFELKGESNRTGNVSILNSQIRKIKNDEQALNQQVVSLLVMNRFYPVETNQFQAGQALESSSNSMVGDLISNQLTYWVSQFSEDVKYLENLQVGFNYQQQGKVDGEEISQQELEVALSTSLFDDRVEISGSMDMENSAGNVEVTYKLTEEGRVRVKVFSRNNNSLINENIQTQGTGLIWSKEFNSWKEFFQNKQEKPKNDKGRKEKGLEKPDPESLETSPDANPQQN